MILKICGITNQEDADAAAEGGANAIGFNFYPSSPRFIAPERAAGIGLRGHAPSAALAASRNAVILWWSFLPGALSMREQASTPQG